MRRYTEIDPDRVILTVRELISVVRRPGRRKKAQAAKERLESIICRLRLMVMHNEQQPASTAEEVKIRQQNGEMLRMLLAECIPEKMM